ncbi:MAG: group II truncated hemoglobin [Gammaproteobacteria bacterium]
MTTGIKTIPCADSLYEQIGGEQPLRDFVIRLYEYMDSLLEVKPVRDMHSHSMEEAGERLFRFMSGWLGGPPLYQQTYGPPRLRRRHMHIPIGNAERDQWLLCAQKSIDDMDWPDADKNALMFRLQEMANHLRNQSA